MSTTTEMPEMPVRKIKKDLSETVANGVIQKLGTPNNFLKTKAINVFGNSYRVNVYTIVDDSGLVKKSSIMYSYLVKADDNGNIVESKPEIVKQFE